MRAKIEKTLKLRLRYYRTKIETRKTPQCVFRSKRTKKARVDKAYNAIVKRAIFELGTEIITRVINSTFFRILVYSVFSIQEREI